MTGGPPSQREPGILRPALFPQLRRSGGGVPQQQHWLSPAGGLSWRLPQERAGEEARAREVGARKTDPRGGVLRSGSQNCSRGRGPGFCERCGALPSRSSPKSGRGSCNLCRWEGRRNGGDSCPGPGDP